MNSNKSIYAILGIIVLVLIAVVIAQAVKLNKFDTVIETSADDVKTEVPETVTPKVSDSPKTSGRQTLKPMRPDEKLATVNYTDKGFNPFSIEIKAGETVRFVNQSSKGMRITSNYVGKNSVAQYQGLEQGVSASKGGEYRFTFIEKGVWGYFNLNTPQHKGVIVVK